MGAPQIHDWDQVRADLLQWVREGKTLTSFSQQEGKPTRAAITNKFRKDKAFAEELAEAKEEGADVLVERTMKILKTPPTRDRMGRVDNGFVQWMKLQLEHSMRIAGLWSSKYSQKKQVEHTGGVTFQVITGVPEPKTEIPYEIQKVLDVQIGEPVKEQDADPDS